MDRQCEVLRLHDLGSEIVEMPPTCDLVAVLEVGAGGGWRVSRETPNLRRPWNTSAAWRDIDDSVVDAARVRDCYADKCFT